MNSLHLQQAQLHWNSDGLPESLVYGDVYFSRANALGESTHVFLDGNALPERFTQCTAAQPFVIAELGFGSGLNFLNTCRLWDQAAPADAVLHYLACELHPMHPGDLHQLHQLFPELEPYSSLLQQQYCAHTAGLHQVRIPVSGKTILLTLLYGDACELLAEYARNAMFTVDAWFLDGFSPRLNPQLWQGSLLDTVGKLSGPDTTLSTYSVAGTVKGAVTQAGFMIEKAPGFGNKRHMLKARRAAPGTPSAPEPKPSRHVVIVGGGLAGCSTAFALAESGWRVTLLDREPALATQASGNPQGILHFRPVKQLAPDNHFNLYGYLFATRLYRSLKESHGLNWQACGHLQLATTAKLLARFEGIIAQHQYPDALMQLLSADQASELAGIALAYPALFFPDSGWLSPPELCTTYAAHPDISSHFNTRVTGFTQTQGQWQVTIFQDGKQSMLHSDALVIANSADAFEFAACAALPLISNRGQVDIYAAGAVPARTVVCGQSYLVPAGNGVQSIGGSYFLGDESLAAQSERQRWHLEQLADLSADAAQNLHHQPLLMQRSAARSITPDRMPLVGALSSDLPGLYLNLAHGSHGLTRSPICAYWLASVMNGSPSPWMPAMSSLVDPQRYSPRQDQQGH